MHACYQFGLGIGGSDPVGVTTLAAMGYSQVTTLAVPRSQAPRGNAILDALRRPDDIAGGPVEGANSDVLSINRPTGYTCGAGRDAERPGRYSHAEHGNE